MDTSCRFMNILEFKCYFSAESFTLVIRMNLHEEQFCGSHSFHEGLRPSTTMSNKLLTKKSFILLRQFEFTLIFTQHV